MSGQEGIRCVEIVEIVAVLIVMFAFFIPASAKVHTEAVAIISVEPVVGEVLPGENASYNITVKSISALDDPTENVTLSVENKRDGWTYTFNPKNFSIKAGETKYSILNITVPSDAAPGDYYHKIKATVYAYGYEELGSTSETTYTGVKTTAIPEFPAFAIPMGIAILSAILFMRKRR